MKFTFSPESRPLDGYTIKRAIHRGGFGEVYYAVSDAGREVALKLLHDNAEIELRGVQQCLNLSHPNLVTIFDIKSDEDGDKWIIMEFVGGETLDQAMRKHPAGMPIELVRKWLPGLAAGVSFLHTRGLVHRDLKPANIFEQSGLVKVGDVGLSKFITPSRRSAQTQSVGTVYYMAPEIAKGRYGREVDIYALGVILYEMLTGQVPFDGESTGEILMKHLTDAPDLTKLPPRLRGVVGKALNKEPQNRFSSVNEVERAFTDAVLGRGEVFEVEEIKSKSRQPEMEKPFAETIPSDAPIDVALAEDDESPAKFNITPLLTASGVAAMVAVLVVIFARIGISARFLGVQLVVVGMSVYFLTRQFSSSTSAAPKKAQRLRPSMRQSTRARWSSFFSAAFLTVPVTAVLTAGLVLLKPTFFENLNGLAQADRGEGEGAAQTGVHAGRVLGHRAPGYVGHQVQRQVFELFEEPQEHAPEAAVDVPVHRAQVVAGDVRPEVTELEPVPQVAAQVVGEASPGRHPPRHEAQVLE